MNSYYASAERLGIDVLYDADVVDLRLPGGHFDSVDVRHNGTLKTIRAASAVIASGDSRRIWSGCERSGVMPRRTSSCAAPRTTRACR